MRRVLGLATALALLTGSLLAGTVSAGGTRIFALSHTYPRANDSTLFCAKLEAPRNRRFIARAKGPEGAALVQGFRTGDTGRRTVRFEIPMPGEWTFTLKDRRGNVLDRDSYVVPPPPPEGDRRGSFSCL